MTTHYLYFDHALVAKFGYGNPYSDAGLVATVKRWSGLHDEAADRIVTCSTPIIWARRVNV